VSTVGLDVTLVISADSVDDVTETIVFAAMVDTWTALDLDDLADFEVSWMDDSYRRRQLGDSGSSGGGAGTIPRKLNSGTAIVTFILRLELAGFADAAALLLSEEDKFALAITEGDFTAFLESECGCVMSLESAALSLARGYPTQLPTELPSPSPSGLPTEPPSHLPVPTPTGKPTFFPSVAPSPFPTAAPSGAPSQRPSYPTSKPSVQPTALPSTLPTVVPTDAPSKSPTRKPTEKPTAAAARKTRKPSSPPSPVPTHSPSVVPSSAPTAPPSCADCDDEDDDDDSSGGKKGKGKRHHHHSRGHGTDEDDGDDDDDFDEDLSTSEKVKEFKGELKQADAERKQKAGDKKAAAAAASASEMSAEEKGKVRESKRLSAVREDLEKRMLSSLQGRIASAELNLNVYEHAVEEAWALEETAAAAAAKAVKKASRLPVSIFDVRNERTLQQLAAADASSSSSGSSPQDGEGAPRAWEGDRFSGATALGAALALVGALAALFAASGNDPSQAWSRRSGYSELAGDGEFDLDHLEFDDADTDFVGKGPAPSRGGSVGEVNGFGEDPDALDAHVVFGGRPSKGLQHRYSAADMESPL